MPAKFDVPALGLIRNQHGRSTLATLSAPFAQLSEVNAIRERLLDDGLMAKVDNARRRVWVRVVFGAVLLVGVIRLVAGVHNGHPVGGLVLEIIVAVVVGLLLTAESAEPVPTRGGKALTAELKHRYTGMAGSSAVAVLGLAALGDATLSKYLLKGGGDHSGGGGGGGCGG